MVHQTHHRTNTVLQHQSNLHIKHITGPTQCYKITAVYISNTSSEQHSVTKSQQSTYQTHHPTNTVLQNHNNLHIKLITGPTQCYKITTIYILNTTPDQHRVTTLEQFTYQTHHRTNTVLQH